MSYQTTMITCEVVAIDYSENFYFGENAPQVVSFPDASPQLWLHLSAVVMRCVNNKRRLNII